MSNAISPKQMQLSKRQERILGYLFKGERHDTIAKKIGVSVPTFYSDLKAIKEKCGIIPEEIVAEMALEQVRQLRKKLENCWEDLLESRADWLEEKDKRGTDDHRDTREQMLEDKYVRMQMQHSFAMRDIIQFKKATGIYTPDVQINTGDHHTTVIFQGMKQPTEKIAKKTKEINPRKGKN